MASLYKRFFRGTKKLQSPYYYLKYKTANGVVQVCTKCRIGDPVEERRARKLAAERALEEIDHCPGRGRPAWRGDWRWVTEWFKVKYQASPATLERYLSAWPTIELFLKEKKIPGPPQLLRRHCYEYITWRQTPEPKKGKYKAGHNTALLELKVLRIVMQESVDRETIDANPCLRLGIRRHKTKPKPEFVPEEYELIERSIPQVEDPIVRRMLDASFRIARYQGCRLAMTRLDPQSDVTIWEERSPENTIIKRKRGTITFRNKGGDDHQTVLHEALIPYFEQLKREGKRSTWDPPPTNQQRQWASAKWHKFRSKLGLRKTFHSTRVTTISEMARNGVHITKAKRYVGHANTTVHEIYVRVQLEDLRECSQAIGQPVSSEDKRSGS